MTPCPLCRYVMDDFDTECRRCHGKGIPTPVAPSAPATQAPAPVAAAPPAAAAVSSGSPPEYALIARETGLSENRLYRLYDAGDSLLMIHAGPYDMFLREELEAERDARGKSVNKADIAGKAIAHGARAGISAGAAGMGIGAVGAGIVVGLGMLSSSIAGKGIKQRTELLDLMTLDELREEAESDAKSFVIRRDNVEHVKIRSRSDGFFSADEPHFAGFWKFNHRDTGKWNVKIFARRDLNFAAECLARVLGEDRIERKLR